MSDHYGETDRLADLAPAYALGALSPEEASAFERALAASPSLQRAVAEYREVCAVLAAAQRDVPPVELKERLLNRVRSSKVVEVRPLSSGKPRSWWILTAALAAALILAVTLWRQTDRLRETVRERDRALAEQSARLATREAELDAILKPGVQLVTLTTTGEASPVVQVFWDRQNNTALLHSFRLKPAAAGRAYQLWLLPRQGNPIASRVFNTDPDGHGLVAGIPVPAGSEIAGFALTEEPASGSPQPTSTPFLVGVAGTR